MYTPPLTYKRDEEGEDGSEIIPGLAEEVPEPTNGGKTYEFTLRKGLKYSDGTPVKASDFEHTIKRAAVLGAAGRSSTPDRGRRGLRGAGKEAATSRAS